MYQPNEFVVNTNVGHWIWVTALKMTYAARCV